MEKKYTMEEIRKIFKTNKKLQKQYKKKMPEIIGHEIRDYIYNLRAQVIYLDQQDLSMGKEKDVLDIMLEINKLSAQCISSVLKLRMKVNRKW
jgi:hypothetical protein